VGGTLHITYRTRADATPAGEFSALAAIYAFLLNKKAAEQAPKSNGSDDHERLVNEQRRSA
jgi:uncharacterized protein YfaQ (DUF2300 family)